MNFSINIGSCWDGLSLHPSFCALDIYCFYHVSRFWSVSSALFLQAQGSQLIHTLMLNWRRGISNLSIIELVFSWLLSLTWGPSLYVLLWRYLLGRIPSLCFQFLCFAMVWLQYSRWNFDQDIIIAGLATTYFTALLYRMQPTFTNQTLGIEKCQLREIKDENEI